MLCPTCVGARRCLARPRQRRGNPRGAQPARLARETHRQSRTACSLPALAGRRVRQRLTPTGRGSRTAHPRRHRPHRGRSAPPVSGRGAASPAAPAARHTRVAPFAAVRSGTWRHSLSRRNDRPSGPAGQAPPEPYRMGGSCSGPTRTDHRGGGQSRTGVRRAALAASGAWEARTFFGVAGEG